MAGRKPTGTVRERGARFEVIFDSQALSAREVFDSREEAEAWRTAAAGALRDDRAIPDAANYRCGSGVGNAPVFTAEQRVRTEFALAFGLWHRREFDQRHTGQPKRAKAVEAYLEGHIQPFLVANNITALQDLHAGTGEKLGLFLAGRQEQRPAVDSGGSGEASGDDGPLDALAAAARCGRSKATINRARIKGKLIGQQIEGAWHYRPSALQEAGLLDAPARPRGLGTGTARDVIRVVREVMGFAAGHRVENLDPCWQNDKHWKAVKPYTKDRGRQPLSNDQARYTVPELHSIAAALPVVHQLVLWMLAVLALRLGEAFGPRVGDFIDEGHGGLLLLTEQGGRSFLRRCRDTGAVTTADRAELKTWQSARVVVVPEALAKLIRIIIEVFHTDPLTGLVDLEARLVPPLNTPTGSQASFTSAFNTACQQLGLDGRTPHGLRKRMITKLSDATDLAGWVLRRFAGHRAGTDVHDRHYMIDDPEMRKLREVAAEVDRLLSDEVDGNLLVPTALEHTIQRRSPLAARMPTIEAALRLKGWMVQAGGENFLDSKQVAACLGCSPGTATRRMREGSIAARQVVKSGKRIWVAHADDVEAIRKAEAGKLRLADVAAELGLTYHQAYEQLKALGRHQSTGRELLLTPDDVAVLREHTEAARVLRERSVPAAEALATLRWAPASFSRAITEGRLDVDPEQAGWILRSSLDAAAASPRRRRKR